MCRLLSLLRRQRARRARFEDGSLESAVEEEEAAATSNALHDGCATSPGVVPSSDSTSFEAPYVVTSRLQISRLPAEAA